MDLIGKIIPYLKTPSYKKIIIHFYEEDEKSKRVLEKLGFKFVKKKQKHFKPTDKYINDYEYILMI